MAQHPRYDVTIHMRADILDDRFNDAITAEQRYQMEQASAYVEVALTTQILQRLCKQMPAQLAQYAVEVFQDELKHVYLRIGQPTAMLLEAPAEVVSHDTPMLEVGPTSHSIESEDQL